MTEPHATDADTAAIEASALLDGAAFFVTNDAIIAVRGDDRREWLSGMVTNRVEQLGVANARYTVLVEVKGKIITDAWIVERADEFLLVVPAERVDPLLTHLDGFIVMEDVSLERHPGVIVAVSGPKSDAAFRALDEKLQWHSDRLGRGGFDVCVPPDRLESIRERLRAAGAIETTVSGWRLAHARVARPQFGTEFGTDHYVQEADLASRAVSFQKGCYIGQEVVCRLELRGHVRRKLVAFETDAPTLDAAATVTSGSDSVGKISSAVFDPAVGRTIGLAMIKWDALERNAPLEASGSPLRIRETSP